MFAFKAVTTPFRLVAALLQHAVKQTSVCWIFQLTGKASIAAGNMTPPKGKNGKRNGKKPERVWNIPALIRKVGLVKK